MEPKTNAEASAKSPTLTNPTFGVELEFITCNPPHTLGAREYVATHLLSPITIPCGKAGCGEGAHKFLLPVRELTKGFSENAYRFWNVTTDASVGPDIETERHAAGRSSTWAIELQSRIMNFLGTTPCPYGQVYPCTGEPLEWLWRDEIGAIVGAINRAYSRPGYRACVNDSAGMHVHLGNGKSPMPVDVTKGVTATFTALERLIDGLLPSSRVYGYEGHFGLPGVDATNMAQLFEDSAHRIWSYCRGMASVLLRHSEIDLLNELEKIPKDRSQAVIEQAVRSVNVPAWLELIKQQPSNGAMEDLWKTNLPFHIFADGHQSAVNLQNLNLSTRTIEVRAHQASLDVEEIVAWVDLMGKTALWTSAAPDVFGYLLTAWADTKYTILNFADVVGADASTIAHYIAKLQPDFARERYRRLIAAPQNPQDGLHTFTRAIEYNRYMDIRRISVLDKIRWKTLTGRYGQMPPSLLREIVPPYITETQRGSYLNLDSFDWNAWLAYSLETYQAGMKVMIEENGIIQAEVDAAEDEASDDESDKPATTTTRGSGPFGVNYPSDESPSSGSGDHSASDGSGSFNDSDFEEAFSFGDGDDGDFEASTVPNDDEAETPITSGDDLGVTDPDPKSAEAEHGAAVSNLVASLATNSHENENDYFEENDLS